MKRNVLRLVSDATLGTQEPKNRHVTLTISNAR